MARKALTGRNRWLVYVAALASLFAGSSAIGDWPMARHDAKRTGLAQGTSDLVKPVPYWRVYMGGATSANQLRVIDIDTDSRLDVVMVTGGRVQVKRLSDEIVWRTGPLGIRTIAGILDVDGDGALDVVVRSVDRVYILNGTTGAAQWSLPSGAVGVAQGVKLGDLTGDGLPELVVQECGCCGVSNDATGFVYSFAGGFGSAQLLWTLPWVACGGSRSLTLFNADGVGPLELLLGSDDTLSVLNGTTGAVVATTPVLGTWTHRSYCRPADVDGAPGEELVCVLNEKAAPAIDQRKVFVLRYGALPAPSLTPMWSAIVAPDVGGDVRYADVVSDLNGDGALEVVVSGKDAADVWTTKVWHAQTGVEIGTLAGEIVSGTAPVGPAGAGRLLTTTSDGLALTGWELDLGQATPLQQAFVLPNRATSTYPTPGWVERAGIVRDVVAVDLDADGVRDLVTTDTSNPSIVTAYNTTGATPTEIASHLMPAAVQPSVLWIDSADHLVVARNDGLLEIFEDFLRPIATSDDILGVGVRIGGYYSTGYRDLQHTPVVGSLAAGPSESIVVPDSRSALLRIDVNGDNGFASPPGPAWSRTSAFAPAIVDAIDSGTTGIACLSIKEPIAAVPEYQVSLLDAAGGTVWSVPIENDPFNDIVPGQLDGDGITDLVVQWGDPGDTLLRTRGVSGANGSTLWDSTPIDPGWGRQPAGVALGSFDADASNDVYFQGGATRVLSGTNGQQISSGGPDDGYFHPTLFNVDADGADEVTLHGGFSPARTLDDDLSTTLWAGADDRPYPYGAVSRCADGRSVLVEGSLLFPSRLTATNIGGSNVGEQSSVVLASGGVFSSEDEATFGGAFIGQLTSAAAHENLTGTGDPSVLVGSTDGWLYGFDPCSLALQFAVDLGASVGEPVFGDTDGDGRDEILVTAADGFLYGLKNEAIAAPDFIWDTNPDNGITDRDVNSRTTTRFLSARWGVVMDALGYEVAVVDSDRNFVTDPPWQNVGLANQVTLDLPLADDAAYFFAVRATGLSGPSVDAVSNGLVISFTNADDGPDAGIGNPGDPGGGCCDTGGSGSPAGALVLGLAVVALIRRRRS